MKKDNLNLDRIAEFLTKQVKDFIPEDFDEEQKNYIINKVKENCLLYAEKLKKDKKSSLKEDQMIIVLQFIREWILNRTIELLKIELEEEIIDKIVKENIEQAFEIVINDQIKGISPKETALNLDFEAMKECYSLARKKILDRDKYLKFLDPDKFYERLGIDLLRMQIGFKLIEIIDPEKADGFLLHKLAITRKSITDNKGYILPNVRILDSSNLDQNEALIEVRNRPAARFYVYTDKFAVYSHQWNTDEMPIPEDTIIDVEPFTKIPIYWINPEKVDKNYDKTIIYPIDFILKQLEKCCYNYADSIITTTNIFKLKELAGSADKLYLELINILAPADLRNVYVNLIREKINVKDVLLIFDRLLDYARFSKDPDVLSEKLRKVFAWQICLDNANEEKIISAIELSQEWLDILESNLKEIDGKKVIKLDKTTKASLVEQVNSKLRENFIKNDIWPVILCPSDIRLPLFRLLADDVPVLTVIADEEITKDVTVNLIGIV